MTFDEHTQALPGYLAKLEEGDFINLADLKNAVLPQAGIYVFYTLGIAQYVGRTGRLKARLREHGQQSSSHFSASFAFILAKKQAFPNGVVCTQSRAALAADPDFNFKKAKKDVRSMQFKFVELSDPIAQTLFEVYAALTLKTPHNSFDPH